MGRDTYRYRQLDKEREERNRIPPLWRGLGCLVLSIVMLLGYWFTGWFLQANAQNGWIYIPRVALAPDLPNYLNFLEPAVDQGVLVRLVIGFLFVLAAYGVLAVAYAITNPIKPRDIDAPTPRKRRRKEKRRKA
ncbi:MAG: hypothetical protein ACK2T2_03580 [Anaerolineales bacterium]|jgi:hypothetical protein